MSNEKKVDLLPFHKCLAICSPKNHKYACVRFCWTNEYKLTPVILILAHFTVAFQTSAGISIASKVGWQLCTLTYILSFAERTGIFIYSGNTQGLKQSKQLH